MSRKKNLSGIKFEGIELLSVMGSIVGVHTEHYRSDFDIDRKILTEAAGRHDRTERTYLWLCRTMGTWLLSERDVFIRNTREYNTFSFYAEQASEGVIAYAVEVTGMDGNAVIGNLYTLDYLLQYRYVVSSAVNPGSVLFVYENGQRVKSVDTPIYGYDDTDFGKFQYFEFQPESSSSLSWLLSDERRKRNDFKTGNFDRYLAAI